VTNSVRARCTHVPPSPCVCRYAATPNFTWHFSPVLSLVGGGYGYWAINLNGVQFKYSNGQSSAQLASGNSYAIVDTVRCGCGRAGVAFVADAVLCAGNVVHRSTCKPIQYHRPAGMLTGWCRCSLLALSRGVMYRSSRRRVTACKTSTTSRALCVTTMRCPRWRYRCQCWYQGRQSPRHKPSCSRLNSTRAQTVGATAKSCSNLCRARTLALLPAPLPACVTCRAVLWCAGQSNGS